MIDLLKVPMFARLDDFLGIWAMEPIRCAALWEIFSRMDLRAHIDHEPPPLRSAMEKLPTAGGKSIAIVRLTGTLMKSQMSMGGTSSIQARKDIRAAAADQDVPGIMLLIDSPGGTVAGTADLAADVKAAAKQKPVWAHVDDLAASAAYWVASQADRITANAPTALIGSIGTIQTIRDTSGTVSKTGVKTLTYATGPFKAMGAGSDPVTDDQSAHVQALVNDVQKNFDAAVQSGRKMSDAQLAAVRHGGVFHATDALKLKLIDAVQPLSKTLAEFQAGFKQGMSAEFLAALAGETTCGIDLATGELVAFVHNSDTSPSEPDWGSVDKEALPRLAFADPGEAGKKSTWSYPHHWVKDAGGKDKDGIWTTGTLLLHKGGLNAAWSAAQGGRSGKKASAHVISPLEAHRKALGLEKSANSFGTLPLLKLAGLPVLSASEK